MAIFSCDGAEKHELAVVELKALVPAKDFELSKRFYIDLVPLDQQPSRRRLVGPLPPPHALGTGYAAARVNYPPAQ